ncbi:MAG: ADP-ribosylation factor-like protein [Candidatus Helarchaeota archaeon]
MVLKILLMGLNGAGKTTLIRHVLEGKEFEELISLPPTEGIKTDEYRYRRLIEISVFDCGGQKQFLEGYFSERMERAIFSNTRVFIWVVDVADKEKLGESRFWFKQAYNSLRKFSPKKVKIYVLAHKYDLKPRISKDELKKFFSEGNAIQGVTYYTSSVKTKTARKILCRILNNLIEKTETERMKNLQRIIDKVNKKLNAKLTMLINKDDGLEITSSMSPELEAKLITKEASDFLQYLSIKTLIYPLNIAEQLIQEFRKNGFLKSKHLNTTVFKFDEEYLLLKDIHKYVSIFIITPINRVSIDKYEQEINKITPDLLTVLKLQ